jgi:hypothetical protein
MFTFVIHPLGGNKFHVIFRFDSGIDNIQDVEYHFGSDITLEMWNNFVKSIKERKVSCIQSNNRQIDNILTFEKNQFIFDLNYKNKLKHRSPISMKKFESEFMKFHEQLTNLVNRSLL